MGIDATVYCIDCDSREGLDRAYRIREGTSPECAEKVLRFVLAHPGHRIAIFDDHEWNERVGDIAMGMEPFVPRPYVRE